MTGGSGEFSYEFARYEQAPERYPGKRNRKQEQAKWINLKNNKRLAVTDREAADKYISAMN